MSLYRKKKEVQEMNKTLNTIAIGAITLYMAVIATDVYEGSTLQDKVHNGVKKLKEAFSNKD
jgi:hypothetical protein